MSSPNPLTRVKASRTRYDRARDQFHESLRAARSDGLTFEQIAHAAGLSWQRVRQIVKGDRRG